MWKYFAVVYPLIFVLILPIFLSPAIHSQNRDWITKPTLIHFAGIFIILSGDFLSISLISGLLIMWYFFTSWFHGKFKSTVNDWNFKFILISLLFPGIASFAFSLVVKPILVLQYLVICLVPFVLLLSAALDKIQRSRLFKIVLILLVSFSLVRLYGWYSGDKKLALTIPNNTEEWKAAAQFISNNAQDNDAYFVLPTFSQQCFSYYYNQEPNNIDTIGLKLGTGTNHSTIVIQPNNDSLPLQTIPEKYTRVWYILNGVVGKEYNKIELDVMNLLKNNYTLKEQKNFFRLTLYLYEIKKN